MPLLNKKPFEPAPIPTELEDNDRVYYCDVTNEIFISYDDYFDRQIQLTSTFWTCEYTGKSGLTFAEALESEKAAMASIGSFPTYLELPILYIIHRYTCRGQFDQLLNDLYFLLKDRYFIGEECFYTESGKKRNIKVLSCRIDPSEKGEPLDKGDTSGLPSPSCYRYNIQILDDLGSRDDGAREDVDFMSLGRNKQAASRPKLKLFLKNCCYLEPKRYTVKKKYLEDGTISNLNWNMIMAGPEPNFPQTQAVGKGRPSKSNGFDKEDDEDSVLESPSKGGRRKSEKGRVMSEKKRQRIISQQEELSTMFESAKRLHIDVSKYQQMEKILTGADIQALKEVMKTARIKEREDQRELKKQKQKVKNQWHRKRDDLECDDLKPLPEFPSLNLPSWLSGDDLAEYLMILQFFTAFSDLLPIKEIRGTSRITLTDIIVAVRCRDPQKSTFADLVRVLLSAKTDMADAEDGDEADLRKEEEIALIKLQNCDPGHPVYGDDIKEATQLHENLRLTHGTSLRHFPVDWMTVAEVLRLTFQTSGYYTGQNTHRHRLFARGYYKGYEDPGFVLAHENLDLMYHLKKWSVFHLSAEERLTILDTLIRQLLTYAKFRTVQEDKNNQLWEQKRELKKLRLWDEQQGKEAKESRLAQEYEMDKMKEEGITGKPKIQEANEETKRLKALLQSYRTKETNTRSTKNTQELEEMLLAGVSYNQLEIEDIVLARELQKEQVKVIAVSLQNTIFDMMSSFGNFHLGRDRAFRNYFVIDSIPIVLVENASERDMMGCCLEPTPIGDVDNPDLESVNDILGCSGSMETCIIHGQQRNNRPRWSYIDSIETFHKIMAACNPRGRREIDLKDELTYHQRRLEELLNKMKVKQDNGQFNSLFLASQADPEMMVPQMSWQQEMAEIILDFEEKLVQGQIGCLPNGVDREMWRKALLNNGDISSFVKEKIVVEGTEDEILYDPKDPVDLTAAGKMSLAFLVLVQSIPLKYFKKPFTLHKTDENGHPIISSIFQNWQRTILKTESIPATCLYLSTLEPNIHWGKSRLHGKCKMCRRKGAAETLILCENCDKCFHLDCIHLKSFVEGWICQECTVIKKKLAAEEKRKAAKAAKEEQEHLNGDKENTEDGEDNNSLLDSSMDSSEVETTRSGRAVKKVKHNDEMRNTPPLKNSSRRSARMNGHAETPVLNSEEEEEMDSDESVKRPKRRRIGPTKDEGPPPKTLRENDPQMKGKMSKLEGIIREAMKLDYAWPFLEPVDKKEVPDYYQIIKKPIDLQTMIHKIKNHDYTTPDDIKSDMELLVSNCRKYNEEDSEVYECAEQIEMFFDNRLKDVFNSKKRRR